ncbi:MAG: 50S ribosomal protein L27 [Candidatus Sungiibacteriota bacterium]
MAHTKSAGAAKYGRDSQPKYLGIKKSDGQIVKNGDIVVRQRGTKFIAGQGIKRGGDDTLYAVREGLVQFRNHHKTRFDGSRRLSKIVHIIAPPLAV